MQIANTGEIIFQGVTAFAAENILDFPNVVHN